MVDDHDSAAAAAADDTGHDVSSKTEDPPQSGMSDD
jgi:hypothetical protein